MGVGVKKNLKGTWAMKNLGPKTKLQQAFAPKKFVPPKVPPNFQQKPLKLGPNLLVPNCVTLSEEDKALLREN